MLWSHMCQSLIGIVVGFDNDCEEVCYIEWRGGRWWADLSEVDEEGDPRYQIVCPD